MLIYIISEFNPENAAEIFQSKENSKLFGIGCGLYILFAILLWTFNLPWWMWGISLLVSMLVSRGFTSKKAKEKIQFLKTKQGIDYISYDKGWLDFEKGIVRIEQDDTNVKQ